MACVLHVGHDQLRPLHNHLHWGILYKDKQLCNWVRLGMKINNEGSLGSQLEIGTSLDTDKIVQIPSVIA